jgi:hypothetical protein
LSFQRQAVRQRVNTAKETLVNTLLAKIIVVGRSVGPYLALEILLPGGSLIALLLWLYRSGQIPWRSAKNHAAKTASKAPAPATHCRRALRWLGTSARI